VAGIGRRIWVLILLGLPVVRFGFLIRSKIFIFILIYYDAYNFVVGRNKVDVLNRR
jgi:TRAP-type mannitol/chloroaromatic compound transport system permease large subunit